MVPRVSHLLKMRDWVIPPGKLFRPVKVLAKHEGNLEWMAKEDVEYYYMSLGLNVAVRVFICPINPPPTNFPRNCDQPDSCRSYTETESV